MLQLKYVVPANGRVAVQNYDETEPIKAKREVAEIIAKRAARTLILDVPKIRFFRQQRWDKLNAAALIDRNEIWIASDLDVVDVIRAVFHESRHLWHHYRSEWRGRSEAAAERDCRLFTLRMVRP